jgi:lipid A ethanolaminephosphotransferase
MTAVISFLAKLAAARQRMRTETLVLLASVFFAVAANAPLWMALLQSRSWSAAATWRLALGTALLMVGLHWCLLLLVAGRQTVKPLLCLLFAATAVAVYFMTSYGVYLDPGMLRNVLATDARESSELLSFRLLPYLLVLGVVPSLLLHWVWIPHSAWPTALARRSLAFGAGIGMVALGAWLAMPSLVPKLRAQHELRYLLTPSNYLYSLAVAGSHHATAKMRQPLGADARIADRDPARKPVALVLVIGETVRAANWGLTGYHRQTTPELAARAVLNFGDTTSCGTSTEVSVPCMFSPYGRHAYDEQLIRGTESLLHVLNRAGANVSWRGNQSGCKGVCDGLPYENTAHLAARACDADGCKDEVLLENLNAKIDAATGDVLVVLHMQGNHGPAYYRRYPHSFRHWLPTCDSPDLDTCDRQALVNTYDNAVLYTDHLLAQAVERLGTVTSHDNALIFVADHGESLGEHHLYLHGAPYAIAPAEQIHVPLVMWLSPGFSVAENVDLPCMQRRAQQSASHDYLFHTVLGMFDVRTAIYDRRFDLIAPCRHADRPSSFAQR